MVSRPFNAGTRQVGGLVYLGQINQRHRTRAKQEEWPLCSGTRSRGVWRASHCRRLPRRIVDSCGITANIASTEALAAVFGDGGEEGADVTCRGPSLCGAARVRLVQELATARRFVAELESVPAISGKPTILVQSRLCWWKHHSSWCAVAEARQSWA